MRFASVRQVRALRAADSRLFDLVVLYLAVKLGLVAVALLGSQLLPFNWQLYNDNLVLDIQGLPELFRAFNTWDTQHYLLLSQSGYGVNPMSDAFYPLFPYLIWSFTPLFFGKGLIAAYVIANLFSLLVPVYMYKLCCLFWSREQAFRATLLLLAFPTAFFMSIAYAEALYLSICLMAFYYLFRQDVLKSSLLCFLLPLTRAQALLFVAPILTLFFERVSSKKEPASGKAVGAVRTYLPPALATLAGAAVYFAWCQWSMGDFRAGLAAQRLYVADNALVNLLHPVDWLRNNFVEVSLTLHGYTTSTIDRVFFVLCAPLLIGIYRTQNKALFTYAATTMLIPALAGNFMAYTRYLFVVFPMFIYLGTRAGRSEFLAIPLFALQVLLFILHTRGYWVA